MQAPIFHLLVTAGLSGALAISALVAISALPWSEQDLRATDGALGRGARWLQAQVLLTLAGSAARPPEPPRLQAGPTAHARAA